MVKIKICGITNPSDALQAYRLGADFLGFIFYKGSPRYIPLEKAKEIFQRLPPSVKKVGVFVNERIENVKRIAKFLKLDFLQFHGDETKDYISKFKGYKIIKSFRIKDKDSLEAISEYKNADLYLLDTYVKRKRGGTGKTFNWDLACKLKRFKKPLILSGGLNPKNVVRAIKKVRPYGVDVCSGVEKNVGKKDLELMSEFIRKARYAAKLYCSLQK